MRPKKLGVLLIVSGPSGAGKSSICKLIRRKIPGLYFSVSCTTRKPRPGEKNGVDYFYLTKKEFVDRISVGGFLEYAKVHSNYYGTLKSEVVERIKKGVDVLLDIDVKGTSKIKKLVSKDSLLSKCVETVFIGPPSFAELKKRLRSRATESETIIRERLDDAKDELGHWRKYDYLIINKTLEKAVSDMIHLLDIAHKKTIRLKDSGFYE
jgi:guanylate kinase